MKHKKSLSSLLLLFMLTALFIPQGCQKDPIFEEDLPDDHPELVQQARLWVEENKHFSKNQQLDFSTLDFAWDESRIRQNKSGIDVVSVPVRNERTSSREFMQFSFAVGENGEKAGMVRQYIGDMRKEKVRLNIYSMVGQRIYRGNYNTKTRQYHVEPGPNMRMGKRGKLQKIASMSSASNDGTEDDEWWDKDPNQTRPIEEVHVWPPGQEPDDPSDWGSDPGGNGGGAAGGGGGGNNGGVGLPVNPEEEPPTLEEIKEQIEDDPFALFGDLDCDVVQKWLATAKHQVQQAQLNKLNSIVGSQTIGIGQHVITIDKIASVQKIDDAYSTTVNMDYFPITVSTLPSVNGQRLTPTEFLEHIRKNINDFVDTNKSEFEPYKWYNMDETALWNSSDPTGAVIGIDIGGPDNGSVIVSHSSNDKWTFSTIFDPKYNLHPVSGNRDFGYTQNANGSYTFYTRGVDRLTTFETTFIQQATGIPFNQADALWNSFQNKISSYVNNNGGNAQVAQPEIQRPVWQEIKDVVDGKKPLSTLSSDCND